jgi:hypothetical protein
MGFSDSDDFSGSQGAGGRGEKLFPSALNRATQAATESLLFQGSV